MQINSVHSSVNNQHCLEIPRDVDRVVESHISKMELLLSEYFSLGNSFLVIVFLLILNQLIELYQFRNMPPGPRLTSLPFIGNMLSFDAGISLRETTARFVNTVIYSFIVIFLGQFCPRRKEGTMWSTL